MNKIKYLILFLIFFSVSTQVVADKKVPVKGKDIQRGNGMEFIENKGQIVDIEGQLRPDILYMGDGGGAKVYLRKGGLSYVMTHIDGLEEDDEEEEETGVSEVEVMREKMKNASIQGQRIDMDFVGGNMQAKVIVDNATEGYFNYYLGHCPQGITGVKAYNKIVYKEMYKNIDIAYYGGKKDGLKYDMVVKPGGNLL